MLTTPADQNGCVCRLLPRLTRPSPRLWVGRHPHCPFRGLLRLHSRYGPHACSTVHHAKGVPSALRGLYHGSSTQPVAQPRARSTSSIDISLGGALLHRCFEPSRRTRVCRRRLHRGLASGARQPLGTASTQFADMMLTMARLMGRRPLKGVMERVQGADYAHGRAPLRLGARVPKPYSSATQPGPCHRTQKFNFPYG